MPPSPPTLDASDPRFELHERVREAILALPGYFRTKTVIEGLAAQDLFTLNSTLGATIEQQVVQTLNTMREVWDPDGTFKLYRFDRQAQTFPDVRLARRSAGGALEIAFGIELKGWYLLSKEAEPSFRYSVNPGFCSPWDLLVVVPWYLDNILSGSPVVLEPFICSAQWAAARRNHWWQHERTSASDTSITPPAMITPPPPYPSKADRISDKPASDSGKNFGRIARVKAITGEWVDGMLDESIAGIPARNWIAFYRMHAESASQADIETRLGALAARVAAKHDEPLAEQLIDLVDRLLSSP
jgi:hypothetical protein